MNNMTIIKKIVHIIFRSEFKKKCIKKFAKGIKNKKILEIGSGKKEKEKYLYSVKKYFDDSNKFIQSDLKKDYGHRVIDVLNMNYKNEFDIVLCLNVLEHVFDFHKAIENIHKALKKGGTLVILAPLFYPLHDEPYDYWRFTKHSIKKLLKKFKIIKMQHSGIKKCPFAYYVEAIK